ncbi:methionyl-tRNA formyltransferase [Moritella sp. Urea-trap-13]|uniref:methionyl-tRNA formyltransferase n=1 Tax=Moritella sp. Urea-trap-13 TaxID=2058327 RepID=UPI000C3204D4|nr:formyltransferase family protein [Moritella sp. Urea-trap-13]PKH07397.1 methionyl-tRNA formyltransferase [Moritella sp. Urea-trap-13]
MENKAIRLVLFASSSVVIPTINKLLQAGQLVGVVLTARNDADAMQLKQQLDQGNIPNTYYQPENPEQMAHQVESWRANTGLIFTFSHKLPLSIINVCRNGFYNLHASALPQYRGAMPLYWQIRNRESQSYLSMIKVEEAFDSGDIMLQQAMPLHVLDTLNSLGHMMAELSAEFVQEFLAKLQESSLIAKPHLSDTDSVLIAAPMPNQQDLMVNWQTMNGEDIAALARAGNPLFNGAMLVWNQSFIGLLQATPVKHANYGVPAGTVLHIGEPEGLIVATLDGALRLDVLTITEGVFSGLTFAERFGLDAGILFGSTPE